MADLLSTAVAPKESIEGQSRIQKLEETEFVLEFVEKSREYRQQFEEIWEETLANYMVSPEPVRSSVPRIGSRSFTTTAALRTDDRTHSILKDPESNQVVETLAAQGIGLLMPQTDYVQAVPIGFDDPEKARYLSRLVQGVLQAPGNYRTNLTTFKDGFIFGTAIQQIGWETRSREQVVRRPVFDEQTGFLVPGAFRTETAEVVYRDMPLLQQVDIFDFYPDPSGTRIQLDMLGVAKRFRISKQQARRMVAAGIYDRAGVEKAIAVGQRSDPNSDPDSKRFPLTNTDTADQFGMLTGLEYWGESPVTKPRNRVITLLEGQHVRSNLNPYLDGNIPFKEIVLNPITGRFYGLSVLETIRFIQDSIDTLLMTHTDAADLAARPVLLAAYSLGNDPLRLQNRRPNDVIQVNNPDLVKPLQSDLSALRFSAEELLRRKLTAREASGATNPLQAIPTSDRQTATEVSELVRLASQRVELMVQLIERDDYPWIGQTLHSRMRQFLSPQRQQILAGERFPVTLDDVDFDADVRFVGARQAQSKFQKAAMLREAINVIGPNVSLIQFIPELFERYMRDGLDIQDAEEIIQLAQERFSAAQAQAQEAQNAITANENLGTTAGETSRQGVRIA